MAISFNSCFNKWFLFNNVMNLHNPVFEHKNIGLIERIAIYFQLGFIETNAGDRRFDVEEILSMVSNLRASNKEILDILINAKDYWGNERFRGIDIAKILKNNKRNRVTKKLIAANMLVLGRDFGIPAFNAKEIISISKSLNEYNEVILNQLLEAKAEIVKNKKNTGVHEQFSGQNIVKIMKKCKSQSNVKQLEKLMKL